MICRISNIDNMTLKVFLLCSAILNLVSSSSYVLILVQLFSNKQKIFKKTPQKCCVVCKIIDKNWGYLKFIQYYKLYSQKLNFSFVHHSFSLLFLDHSYRTFKARWMPNHFQQGRRKVRKFKRGQMPIKRFLKILHLILSWGEGGVWNCPPCLPSSDGLAQMM